VTGVAAAEDDGANGGASYGGLRPMESAVSADDCRADGAPAATHEEGGIVKESWPCYGLLAEEGGEPSDESRRSTIVGDDEDGWRRRTRRAEALGPEERVRQQTAPDVAGGAAAGAALGGPLIGGIPRSISSNILFGFFGEASTGLQPSASISGMICGGTEITGRTRRRRRT